jgi:carbamoyltransferase
MRIIGLNSGVTNYGMPLKDGGICLIEDGEIKYVLHEERISGKKFAGGFEHSLKECLRLSNLKLEDIDLFVFSSCCDTIWNEKELQTLNLPKNKFISLDHHMSHAFSSFAISDFDDALVVVIDNEGNILESTNKIYWKCPIERTSYYHAKRDSNGKIEMTLLERDGDDGSISIGEAYRNFTFYLGWKSYVYAGKVMGLAPFGTDKLKTDIFTFSNGKLICNLPNEHESPEQSIKQFLENHLNQEVLPPIYDVQGIDYIKYSDFAHLIQSEIERAITLKIGHLLKKYNLKHVCLSGGVALNCTVNSKLLSSELIEDIFIPPAPGDSGQCLGNALYGYNLLCEQQKINAKKIKFSPYLGRDFSEKEIETAINKNASKIKVKKIQDLKEIVSLLKNNKVIGWFNGRSEMGPRALGNRSILADPRSREMHIRLNNIKNREMFRPLAPVVMEEYVQDYFEIIKQKHNYEFMLFALQVNSANIPAVTHVDNSARAQTVTKEQNPKLYALLKEFYNETGLPVLMNTSLNYSGDPLCDTPEDAISCLLKTEIDFLVIDNYLICRLNNENANN